MHNCSNTAVTNSQRRLVDESLGERRSALRHKRNARVGFHLHKSIPGSLHLTEARNVSDLGVYFTTALPIPLGARIDLLVDMPSKFNGPAQWLCWGRVVRVEALDASTTTGVAVQYDCYEVVRPASRICGTTSATAAAPLPIGAKSPSTAR